jgi:cytoskeletal protein CcmA (bactofilin family)
VLFVNTPLETTQLGAHVSLTGELFVAGDVALEGILNGRVEVVGKLTVAAGAELKGGIECNSLIIEAGADCHGSIEVRRPEQERKRLGLFRLRLA